MFLDHVTLSYAIAMAATVAFAATGVLAVADRGIDLFGATVLGIITAIGGGTIRDVVLQVPIFWAEDLTYVWVALAASVLAFIGNRGLTRRRAYSLLVYTDGLGVALFGIQATDKVWDQGFGLPAAPVILGVVTAIGGGLLRDVLAGRQTILMSRELYAVPVFLGCFFYAVLLAWLPEERAMSALACIVFIFAMRAAAILCKLSVPVWLTTKTQ